MSNLLTTLNPATGQEIASYPVFDDKKIESALLQAQKTFLEWRRTSIQNRATVLNNIARELRRQKEHLAKLATYEMGKPIQQSRDEVEKCATTLEYYANNGEKLLSDEIVETKAYKSYVAFRPLGVVLAVMPWNFPYWQVFRAFAPAAIAGNVLVLKHSSNVCESALAIEKIINNSGAPKGLFQTLLIHSSKVEQIINDPAIAAITFTGSTEAGRSIAQVAGRNLKKAVLELGGSDAYVILEDADLDEATDICIKGRLVNSGQSCVAAKRFVVVKSIKKQFEKLLTQKMEPVTFGDPMDEKNRIGPMARIDLRDALHAQVVQSISLGAKLLCGGYVPDLAGAFYPATVITNIKAGMPAYNEELFGPVAAIIEAKDETDAMRIANDSEFGLGGCILSTNLLKAEKLAANEMDAGNCFVNETVFSDPRLPFGGVKLSGYGRELGTYGIKEFTNIKTVYIK